MIGVCARLGAYEELLAYDDGRRALGVVRVERRHVEGDVEWLVQRHSERGGEQAGLHAVRKLRAELQAALARSRGAEEKWYLSGGSGGHLEW